MSQNGMFTGLPISRDPSFKSTSTSSDIPDSKSDWNASVMMFLIKSVFWNIDDSHTFAGLISTGKRSCDTTCMLAFKFVQDTAIPQDTFFHFSTLHFKLSIVCLLIPPHLWNRWPMVVHLPETTCPMIMLMSFPFPFWLRVSNGFHNTCVLTANPSWKSSRRLYWETATELKISRRKACVNTYFWYCHDITWKLVITRV